MVNLDAYFKIVEDAIKAIGIKPEDCREEKIGQWTLQKGSAKVWLDLWHLEKENRVYFQVISPVLDLATLKGNAIDLYKELLEINHQLYGVGFTIYNNWVYIKVIREADGMDTNEANAMLWRVGSYADQYDDYLKNKYTTPPPTANTNWGGGQTPPAQ